MGGLVLPCSCNKGVSSRWAGLRVLGQGCWGEGLMFFLGELGLRFTLYAHGQHHRLGILVPFQAVSKNDHRLNP